MTPIETIREALHNVALGAKRRKTVSEALTALETELATLRQNALMTGDQVMDEVKRYFAAGNGNPILEPHILDHYAKTSNVVHAVLVSLRLEKVSAWRRKAPVACEKAKEAK